MLRGTSGCKRREAHANAEMEETFVGLVMNVCDTFDIYLKETGNVDS
jgi:hypothetical protein